MTKYFDFDAWREERNAQPIIIKAFGKEYEIPSDVPFDVVLGLVHSMREGVEEITQVEQVLEMAESVFGKDTMDEWRSNRIGVNEIKFMTEKVMAMYQQQSEDIADSKRQSGNTPK